MRLAVPGATIHKSSSFPSWFADQPENNTLLERLSGRQPLNSSAFFVADKVDCDFAVFSGMVVTDRFVRRYGPLIRRMRERGVKIILNGVGPASYDNAEKLAVTGFWRDLGLHGLISRDRYTYETYGEAADHVFDGIDCGFFLSNALSPPKLKWDEYRVLTFDSMEEPHGLASGKNSIRPKHKLYPTPGKSERKALRRLNSFISEQASEYLTIYSNASEVHSDRVHACVAAASFGKPFRLYSSTKRALLFERMGVSLDALRQSLVTMDRERLKEEKDAQVAFLRSLMGS